jgi:hypothetical protein
MSTRDESLKKLFHYQLLDSLPLDDGVRKARLRFGTTSARRPSIGGRMELGFMWARKVEEGRGREKT